MEESAIKIITIVWVGLIPPAVLLAVFVFILITLDSAKIGHCHISSALVGRLGHCTVVVVLWGIYTLEHWNWPKETCFILTWSWITFWIGDLFTTFLYLVYYTFVFGNRYTSRKISGYLVMFFLWIIALMVGGLPVFMESSFSNYDPDAETCQLDLVQSKRNVKIAAVLINILGPLVCFVMCLSINLEHRSIRKKHNLYCRATYLILNSGQSQISTATQDVAQSSENNLNKSNTNNRANNSVNNSNQNLVRADWLARKEVSKCGVIDRGNGVRECEYIGNVRDTRNLLNVLATCTILLNCLPQLVMYAMGIISSDYTEYTHYILVSFGIVHSLALPLLICVSTYRYCYLSITLFDIMCCKGNKLAKLAAFREQNGVSTESNHVISSTQQASATTDIRIDVTPDSTDAIQEDIISQSHTIETQTENAVVQTNTIPIPPPLPNSRQPSVRNSPHVEHKTNGINNSQVNQQSGIKDEHAAANTNGARESNGFVVYVKDFVDDNVDNTEAVENKVDYSVKSVNIDEMKLASKPQNLLNISAVNIVRSNSAVVPHKTTKEQVTGNLRRTSSSQDVGEKNEGPYVEWDNSVGIATLLMQKIQSGKLGYLSSDYHHDAISGHVDSECDDSEYTEDDSSYDSDSAGWSHMYTDTDMEETLERNKGKHSSLKRSPARRIPSNDSSLDGKALVKKKKKHRRKKTKKRKHKKDKDVGKGLGSALQTMMLMPGAQMMPKGDKTNLDNAPVPIKIDTGETIGKKENADIAKRDGDEQGQISPTIGPDGKLIEVPPPPTFPPPLPPHINLQQKDIKENADMDDNGMKEEADTINNNNKKQDEESDWSQEPNNKEAVIFPHTVLPLQTNYPIGSKTTDQQSFSKASNKHSETEFSDTEKRPSIYNLCSPIPFKPTMRDTPKSVEDNTSESQNVSKEPSAYPSFYSMVKARNKAQVAWHKAFTAIKVTDFLKSKPDDLGVLDNGESIGLSTATTTDSGKARKSVSRASAHTYVNTGFAGSYDSLKIKNTDDVNEEPDYVNV